MSGRPVSLEKLERSWQAVQKYGGRDTKGSVTLAADELGIARTTLTGHLQMYEARQNRDPAIQDAMDAIGTGMEPNLAWIKTDKEGNTTYSLQMKPKGEEEKSLSELVQDALGDYRPLDEKLFAPRINSGAQGEHLVIIDPADIHFGKLAKSTETGGEYSVEIARHRMIEGTRALLRGVEHLGVGRILFVLGNDILHTEDGKKTTSGTPQDTDGSWFTAAKAAQQATYDAIGECAAVADVDLVHCTSNHDWRTGWLLSQAIAAGMSAHSRVRATNYNMSERHRKYYGFENNGFMVSHGDGIKEEQVAGCFLREAKPLVSQCQNLYVLFHHFHHKIKKRRGFDPVQTEKDHNSFTAIVTGQPKEEGQHIDIEYVRSPSAPDGWHDRNGYLNRQGVECFGYHPQDGQKLRITEWF